MSSTIYGGNKVRTLQHQLAVCEAKDPTKKYTSRALEGLIKYLLQLFMVISS